MIKNDLVLYLKCQGYKENSPGKWYKLEYMCQLYNNSFKFKALFNGKYVKFKEGLYKPSYFQLENTGASNKWYPFLCCSY